MQNTLSQSQKRHFTGPQVFCLGVVLAFLALSPAILPFGGRFVTRGDFIEQQLPFLLEARRILRAGLNAYSFSTFLGAPGLGSYAFYTLGSPFVWPLALLPKAALPYAVSLMAVLKHACGLTFCFFWLRRMLAKEEHALLCAMLYAFSSFSVVNTQFYHFWEVIAFFPLILLGMEDAMRDPHPGRLALFCGLNALTNYYFMFSSALLAGLYFLFRLFSPEWRGVKPARILFLLFECAAGCALSGFLLLPALRFMMQITRTGARDVPLWAEVFSPAALLERLRALLMPIESGVVHAWFGDAPSWNSCAACLPVFGFAGALFFLSNPGGQHWLRRLLLLLLAACCVPALSGAFALWTNLGYTRWWYGLAVLMALATGYALDSSAVGPADARRRWLVCFAVCSGLCVLLVAPGLIPEAMLRSPGTLARVILNRRTGAYAPDAFRVLSLCFALLGGGVFLLLLYLRPPFRAALALCCLAACCSYAAYIAAGDALLPMGGDAPGTGSYTLSDIAEPSFSALSLPEESDWKRIDYGLRLRNYGLLRGASSLTCFQSLRSSTVGRFISAAGFGYDESTTVTPPDSSGALRAFLSVTEYHRTDPQDPIPEGFVYDREENGFPVYVNPNTVPMGFLQTAVLPVSRARLRREALGETLLSCAVLDDALYTETAGRFPDADPANRPGWQESAARLQHQACDRFQISGSGFTAHIDAPASGLVVFTIPYDKGFSAVIDGQKAEILPCDIAFMAVAVEPGSHEIRFRYRTRGLLPGIGLTLAAAAALLCSVRIRKESRPL